MNILNHCSIFCKKTPLFVEPRKWGYGKFFDRSKMTKGHQSLQNRLVLVMKEIIEPWLDKELNVDEIRILMKKSFLTV